MKIILSVICSLVLIGCSESPPQSNESNSVIANEVKTKSTVAEETKTAVTVDAATVTVTETAIDATTLFAQKCASCHGTKAEKSALNKSQVIAGWKDTQIKDALKGYQSGTYGKEMKALMQGQAKGLSDAQIDALATYISTL
jgi:cytochrome c553